jgi:hypothetical protein
MASTTEYRRREGFVYRHVAGEHLLLALRRDRQAPMFLFTATGAFIWTMLEQWSTVEALVDGVLERFNVEADAARADAESFLAQLTTIGALDSREVG